MTLYYLLIKNTFIVDKKNRACYDVFTVKKRGGTVVKEINMTKVKKVIWSNVPLREIEKLTGVSYETTRQLREGMRSTDAMKVSTAAKFEEAYEKLKERGVL